MKTTHCQSGTKEVLRQLLCLSPARLKHLAVRILPIGFLALVMLFALACQFDLGLVEEREVEIILSKWSPAAESLTIDPRLAKYLTEAEVTQLHVLGITGRLKFNGVDRMSQGPRSRVLLIMQRQLDKPLVELPLPEQWVIYVQDKDGWRKGPSNAPTITKTLRLFIPNNDPEVTEYNFEVVGGGRLGAGAFDWSAQAP